jgi:hypothetical protein
LTTSNKNFKVKNGLEVLGTSATVDGNDVLTTISKIEDLANVDITNLSDGKVLKFNAALETWYAGIDGGGSGGGGASFTVSDTAPTDPAPSEGDVWFRSTNASIFVFYVDVDSSQWVQVGLVGPQGQDGVSAYEVAVANGFIGTEQDWLDSLVGPQGAASTVPGPTGPQGTEGIVEQATPPENTNILWLDTSVDGYGIPIGGTDGQVLTKNGTADNDTRWSTPYTQADADSDIATAIANLLDSAPLALDTLNELAASLGDDANFAATMANALSGKSAVGHTHQIADVSGLQNQLDLKSDTSHKHDSRYYTETEVDTFLSGKSDTGHTHAQSDITDLVDDLDLKAPKASPAITGNASVENLTINGTLTFNGTATTINSSNLSVEDSMIYLASQQYDTDVVDIGIYGAYGDSGAGHLHTGIVRDATDAKWKLISGGTEPNGNVVDFTGATYDTLKLGTLESSNIVSTSATIGNVSNTELQYLDGVTSSVQTQLNALVAQDISVFKNNPNTVSSSYTIPVGYNSMSAGPITIQDGVVVTISDGSSWSVV